MQQQYAVPDKSLKEKLITEIKGIIVPGYETFLKKFNETAADKDRSLVKYPVKVLTHMIDQLFAGLLSDTPKRKKILGIKNNFNSSCGYHKFCVEGYGTYDQSGF